jgi:hypothetical protein
MKINWFIFSKLVWRFYFKGIKKLSTTDLPDGFKIVFAGNIGVSQDMENVMFEAALVKAAYSYKFIWLRWKKQVICGRIY